MKNKTQELWLNVFRVKTKIKTKEYHLTKTLKNKNEYDKIWQAFAVLIPVKTVGVMGDSRTYENLIGLRAVTSRDGMTADWYKMPSEILEICSNRIINEIKELDQW